MSDDGAEIPTNDGTNVFMRNNQFLDKSVF